MIGRARNAQIGAALLAAAVATGVGAAASLGSAPAANASCASVFGFGNSANCHSAFGSIAIGIGSTAVAQADGVLGLAFASGANAGAASFGILGVAISVGTRAQTGVGSGFEILQLGNLAIDFGNHTGGLNAVVASGLGNVAANFGGKDVFVISNGALNSATNVSGSLNEVSTSGFLTSAFAIQSRSTNVLAGRGALALAGSLLQNTEAVEQAPFGININGVGIPPAAGINPAAKQISRKSAAPKSTQSKAAKASKKGSGRSAR